jgi:hypothetical protein
MAKAKTKQGLEVLVIDGTIAPQVHGQVLYRKTLEDGRTRTHVNTLKTESLEEFKQGIEEMREKSDGDGLHIEIYINAWAPHRDTNGFLDLSDHLVLKDVTGERRIRAFSREEVEVFQWQETLAGPAVIYGSSSLRLHLEGTLPAVVEGEEKQLSGLLEYARSKLYPVGHGVAADAYGKFFFVPNVSDAEREIIAWHNEKLGIKTPAELLRWGKRAAPPTTTLAKCSPFGNTLCFTGDNIHRSIVTGLARGSEWRDGEEYFKGFQQEHENLKITISLPNGDQAASLWEFLQKGGAAMVKAHYALWARYYEQVPDGLALQDVVVNINDFCRDLGYAKHKGAYKPETKRRAMQLLEALTRTEMAATFQVPGKTRRLKGTIWKRGFAAEERDTYEDLLGQARAGDPEQWIPCGFSFSPGPWHADKEWRHRNKYVGKIGAGLMQLRVDRDEWAILIGGYLGTLARTGRYQNRRLKISTILHNTGLDKAIGHRQAQFREKFYRALDRLAEEKVIAEYRTEGFNDSDVDPEDLDALAEYGAANPFPKGDWRGYVVEFSFGLTDDAARLQERREKAVATKKAQSQKKRVAVSAA